MSVNNRAISIAAYLMAMVEGSFAAPPPFSTIPAGGGGRHRFRPASRHAIAQAGANKKRIRASKHFSRARSAVR